jgi:hypothetical protein
MSKPRLENRVDPWGRLNAVCSRGTLMGNRGNLHGRSKKILRPWKSKAWVTCLLHFKSTKRAEIFAPGQYSELFFLDEATAFAAGHRPCTYCQRERSNLFKEVWFEANSARTASAPHTLKTLDEVLHTDRLTTSGEKAVFNQPADQLPVGAMFVWRTRALLCTADGFLEWSFEGYREPQDKPLPSDTVSVLTPKSVVGAFRQGFEPCTVGMAT